MVLVRGTARVYGAARRPWQGMVWERRCARTCMWLQPSVRSIAALQPGHCFAVFWIIASVFSSSSFDRSEACAATARDALLWPWLLTRASLPARYACRAARVAHSDPGWYGSWHAAQKLKAHSGQMHKSESSTGKHGTGCGTGVSSASLCAYLQLAPAAHPPPAQNLHSCDLLLRRPMKSAEAGSQRGQYTRPGSAASSSALAWCSHFACTACGTSCAINAAGSFTRQLGSGHRIASG